MRAVTVNLTSLTKYLGKLLHQPFRFPCIVLSHWSLKSSILTVSEYHVALSFFAVIVEKLIVLLMSLMNS